MLGGFWGGWGRGWGAELEERVEISRVASSIALADVTDP